MLLSKIFLILLFCLFSAVNAITDNATSHYQLEREVLDKIYEANGGLDWYNKSQPNHCAWVPYLTCEKWTGKISHLWLFSQGMNGTLPTEIGLLERLRSLRLGDNKLSGEIPSEIGAMKSINYLSFSSNNFTGKIPSEIGMIKNSLIYLRLAFNNLVGQIPSEMANFPRLVVLNLESNQLSGSIPKRFGNFPKLRLLKLSENNLSGKVPTELGMLEKLFILNLSFNNLNGKIPTEFGKHINLVNISLSNNNLSGKIPTELAMLKNLQYLDASSNNLTGTFPTELGKLTSISNLNFNNNSLIGSVSFALFENMQPMELLGLSYNNLRFELNSRFLEIMSGTKSVILSGNVIKGALEIPEEKPKYNYLTHLILGGNCISGILPLFLHELLPRLEELDLSAGDNCKKCFNTTVDCPINFQKLNRKCTGSRFEIPIFPPRIHCEDKLGFWGKFPIDYANFNYLKKFNLSGNVLTGTIPKALGQGFFLIEELDLSHNRFEGLIPFELASIGSGNLEEVTIKLEGNQFHSDSEASLAPASLCMNKKIDLHTNHYFCPSERNHLKSFFVLTNGESWTNNEYWKDEYKHPCEGWFGVRCEQDKFVTNLTLMHNQLSGRLGSEIGNFIMLKVLDLSGNYIRSTVPSEIEYLTNLEEFDLSYNAFRGEINMNFTDAKNLKSMRIHSTNLQGSITGLEKSSQVRNFDREREKSRYIADCGFPSDFDEPIKCEECTICCNANKECEERFSEEKNLVFEALKDESSSIRYFVVIALFLAVIGFLFSLSIILPMKKSLSTEINKNVFKMAGEESVYNLLLGSNYFGWIIAVVVAIVQLAIFYIFYAESIIDFEDESTKKPKSWLYRWECAQDEFDCEENTTVTLLGWFLFVMMVLIFLWPDLWNGVNLIWVAPRIKPISASIRCVIVGTILLLITLCAIFVCVTFNIATASSNVEIIINGVILLFVNDLDENMFRILQTCCPSWLEKAIKHQTVTDDKGTKTTDEVAVATLKNRLEDEIYQREIYAAETKAEIDRLRDYFLSEMIQLKGEFPT